jgi:hypothetical protein
MSMTRFSETGLPKIRLSRTCLSKTLIAVTLVSVSATAATAQGGLDLPSGMAYVYSSGKTSTMAIAAGGGNHRSMMRHVAKAPSDTVFLMSNGQLYSTTGMLDPTGNFYRP